MDKLTASIWFIPIMTRKQTSKLSKLITYRIASLLSATVKTPNIERRKCTGNPQRIRCQYEQPRLCPYIQSRRRRPRFASELRKEHLLLYGLRTPRMVVELPGLLMPLLGNGGMQEYPYAVTMLIVPVPSSPNC